MVYRREIDGLRALAVLPVVLYHAGIAACRGGFVGVDVFFVISGYLITTVIVNEQDAGTFSLWRFYERRARRILPALFLVLLVCLPLAWSLMLPDELMDFSKSLASVSAFASNVFFWRDTGYFSQANELKPLLHTWSLSVEEQYYWLFPVLLLALSRLTRDRRTLWLLAMTLGSLALADWITPRMPVAAFFLLPTRAWEILMGSLIAMNAAPIASVLAPRSLLREWLAAIGIAGIAYAILTFDRTTFVPGLPALLPTVGTALVICAADASTRIGRWLGHPALAGVGVISYSVYLWHQPMLAFLRLRHVQSPSPASLAALVVLALALSYASWRFVERPFRDRQRISRRWLVATVVIGLVGFATLGAMGVRAEGFAGRIPLPSSVVRASRLPARTAECFGKPGLHARNDWLCAIGDPRAVAPFVVFGDSHALALLDAFDEAGRQAGRSGTFTGVDGSVCMPLMGIDPIPGAPHTNCRALNQRVFDYVKDHQLTTVFLVARWTYYTDGGYTGDDFAYLGQRADERPRKAISRAAFEAGFTHTVDAYAGIGVRPVLVEQLPEQRVDAKRVYREFFRDGHRSDDWLRSVSVLRADNDRLQSFVRSVARPFADAHRIGWLSLGDAFCDDAICRIGTVEQSYYRDRTHLSDDGARRVVSRLVQALQGPRPD